MFRALPALRTERFRQVRGRGWIALLGAAGVLAGCGGGVVGAFFCFGCEDLHDFHGSAPAVSLSANPSSAQAGAALQLVAVASDASGIDSVAFYQVEAGGATLLGADGTAPFQWLLAVPSSPTGSVSFFARATDGVGQQADSDVVTVTVVP